MDNACFQMSSVRLKDLRTLGIYSIIEFITSTISLWKNVTIPSSKAGWMEFND